MAQKVISIRISDVSGKELPEGEGQTINFSVGTTAYRIDLSDEEVADFFTALKPYVDNAEKAGGRRGRQVAGQKTDKSQLDAARKWLRDNGHEVSSRGRIKGELMDLYLKSVGS